MRIRHCHPLDIVKWSAKVSNRFLFTFYFISICYSILILIGRALFVLAISQTTDAQAIETNIITVMPVRKDHKAKVLIKIHIQFHERERGRGDLKFLQIMLKSTQNLFHSDVRF